MLCTNHNHGIQEEGQEISHEGYDIDLFSLRVLSLLMCRGEVREKADFLVDLVLNDPKKKTRDVKVEWSN